MLSQLPPPTDHPFIRFLAQCHISHTAWDHILAFLQSQMCYCESSSVKRTTPFKCNITAQYNQNHKMWPNYPIRPIQNTWNLTIHSKPQKHTMLPHNPLYICFFFLIFLHWYYLCCSYCMLSSFNTVSSHTLCAVFVKRMQSHVVVALKLNLVKVVRLDCTSLTSRSL